MPDRARFRYFNNLFFIFLILLLFASVYAFSSETGSTLKVGIYQNQPKIFLEEDQQPSGFWVEIMDAIAAQEGWTVEYVAGSWEECLHRLENGQIDVMPDVAFTEKRDELFLFSDESVYTSWSGIYTQEGEDIKSILDLDGKTIAVLKNSVNYEGPEGLLSLVNAFDMHCTFVEKDDYLQVFEAVQKGQAHAGTASKDFAIRHLSDFQLINTPIIFQPSTLYFAFPLRSERAQAIKERVDFRISQFKANKDSVYYQSMERWFSVNPEDSSIFKWLFWGLIICTGVIALLVSGSLLLRSQVHLRTRELTEEIAERKKAQEELSQHEKQLEETVAARTAALTHSNKELEMFAYITSHDLQEPLRMVTSYLQLIEKRFSQKLDDDGKEFIAFAVEGAKRMQTLINDLLKYSRVGTKAKEFTPVDCNQVLADTLNNLEVAIQESQGCITYDTLPTVTGDETQLRQLFQNLIGNALKFRGEKTPEIHIGVESSDRYWEFTVTDNGIGIDSKYFDRIFQVFQRLHGRNEYSGNGIGLAVCKRIVERHGGEIKVESVSGASTTFTFTLAKEEQNL
ncbi:MAG TPA: ATP-binding protein [Thermotogota bacterium]|nr:ATP-binding protein [Thermotogota bacterium]